MSKFTVTLVAILCLGVQSAFSAPTAQDTKLAQDLSVAREKHEVLVMGSLASIAALIGSGFVLSDVSYSIPKDEDSIHCLVNVTMTRGSVNEEYTFALKTKKFAGKDFENYSQETKRALEVCLRAGK